MSRFYAYDHRADLSALLGLTLTSVTLNADAGEIDFIAASGEHFRMYHEQDCCESVVINDVNGDIADLIDSPITTAEESTSGARPEDVPKPDYEDYSQTWTFYRIGTARGMVVIRWWGSSNGYYSEAVDFVRVPA
jgi:hypothetical protein